MSRLNRCLSPSSHTRTTFQTVDLGDPALGSTYVDLVSDYLTTGSSHTHNENLSQRALCLRVSHLAHFHIEQWRLSLLNQPRFVSQENPFVSKIHLTIPSHRLLDGSLAAEKHPFIGAKHRRHSLPP